MKRRQFLAAVGGSMVCWHSPNLLAMQIKRPKLVWVMLRGAMDSLHAVLPVADSSLMDHRRGLLKTVKGQATPLERGFALHPSLKTFAELYRQKQLLAVVATSSGANTRSHFRAQDIVESGYNQADAESGWLNRAVEAYQGESLAIAHSLPISLRGKHASQTWYPDHFMESSEDLYNRLKYLYDGDEQLLNSLINGLETQAQLGDMATDKQQQKFSNLALSCGKLMQANNGPDCSMLELDGWDTHQRQVYRLDKQFTELDKGLAALRQGLGKQWNNTAVIIATEFGRTVTENGTGGTDHGTASALFLAGGAVRGGRVYGQWPGLKKAQLFEGRDLMPTSDNRQWIAALLKQHWQLNDVQLNTIFPQISPMQINLIR
ncbi:MAG: hypothetical protein CBD32_02220 [Actinobacteria bacterium TMED172]|nr:hypothetical protein [Cellvibrionales bacterium]OUW33489.1 MAG: hypothetical protein CBD32_02220 [Actinobacteria bacterium TMED172]